MTVFEARLHPILWTTMLWFFMLIFRNNNYIFLLVCNNGTRNMLVVNYLFYMWHKYYFLCNLFNYTL
jgi:hypothetical protein